jgi:hypothetical protein
MKSYKLTFLITAMLGVLLHGCKPEIHEPLSGSGDGSTPDPLKSVSVASLPGAAQLTYILPASTGLLYVKAVYEIQPGIKREVRASYYNNSMVVDGFADTLLHQVQLYVVTRDEKQSEPVTVTVSPLTPPYIDVYRSLSVMADFGGVHVSFKNKTGAELAIVSLTPDSIGVFDQADVYYTKVDSGDFSLRGYKAEKRKFGFFIKDRWGNISDTLTGEYTPLYEEPLDKTKFKEVDLPTDIGYGWGFSMPYLWNGVFKGYDMWHSADKLDGMPLWFTFDMGTTAQLSRIGLWQRNQDGGWIYSQNNVREFEVYGSTNPNPNGSWDNSWTLLAHQTVIKPSGLPVGQTSSADVTAAETGELMNVPLTAPRVRYIRVKVLRTWTDGGYAANIAEMSFWGDSR